MQRRAAAVYFVLFVLIGAGAYGFMQVGMSKPAVDLQGETYSQGQELQVGGQTYTVSNVSAGTDEGDVVYSAELTWFNESARETATIENESTIAFDDGEYLVAVPNESDPDSFSLIEQLNVSAILSDDPEVENETATQGDQTYVFYTNGTRVPLSEYLPPADTVSFGVGEEFEYRAENVTARIDAVSAEDVSLSWAAPGDEVIELAEGENATLNGQSYFAHFPNDVQVQILPSESDYGAYNGELRKIENWEQRNNGVWGIVILSVLTAIVLVATAYLPTKG